MSEVLGWFMGSAVLCFFRNLEKPKKICRESWPGPPPSRESGNIGVFVLFVFFFRCVWPPSFQESANIALPATRFR